MASAPGNLLEVSVLVFAVGLQQDGDGGHERFDHTELQSGLLAEAQEPDGVGPAPQAARPVQAAGPGAQRKVPRESERNSKTASVSAFRLGPTETYWMGFPLISAMMALSPPRYS